MTAVLPATGRATWHDRVDNWRSADTDWLQDRVILRSAAAPSPAQGVGGVYFNTADACLMVQTATSVYSSVLAGANLKITPSASGDTIGHKSVSTGLLFGSTKLITSLPITTVGDTVTIDATGITVHTTAATTAKLTTDATTLHSDKPISASSFTGNVVATTTNAGALTATTGTFTSNVNIQGAATLTVGGNTDLTNATLDMLTFATALGQHINMYGTGFGLGVQSSTLYLRSTSAFKFYVGGSHTDTATASVVTIDANSLDIVGSLTATSSLTAASFTVSGASTLNGRLTIKEDTTSADLCLRLQAVGGDPYIDWYNYAATARYGYLQGRSTGMLLYSDQDIVLDPAGNQLDFMTNGTLRARFDGTGMYFGKSVTDLNNAGVEMYAAPSTGEGSIRTTIGNAGNMNLYLRHVSTANANTQSFVQCWAVNTGGTGVMLSNWYQDGASSALVGTRINNCTTIPASDYRLKNDLGPIEGALDRVMQLQPKRLEWKGSGKQFEGFIAHEVTPVAPYVVEGEKDAVNEDGGIESQGVEYAGLTPLLTAAIQELMGRVGALESLS